MSVGAGDYGLGVVATLIILLSLSAVRHARQRRRDPGRACHRLRLEHEPRRAALQCSHRLEAQGARTASAKVTEEDDVRRLDLVLLQTDPDLARLLEAASSSPDVRTTMIAP